jgi:hypothetical protein
MCRVEILKLGLGHADKGGVASETVKLGAPMPFLMPLFLMFIAMMGTGFWFLNILGY